MRACRQCVHESARLSRVICSHAWYSWNRGKRETNDLHHQPVPHALATHYFLRLTRARGKSFQREGNALFDDFCRAFGHSKAREEKKSLHDSFGISRALTTWIFIQDTVNILHNYVDSVKKLWYTYDIIHNHQRKCENSKNHPHTYSRAYRSFGTCHFRLSVFSPDGIYLPRLRTDTRIYPCFSWGFRHGVPL